MTKEPRFLTLDEAAAILRLKDRRTVIKWGQEGRLRVIGEKRHLLVSAASIDKYERGESAWHQRKNPPTIDLAPHNSDLVLTGRRLGERFSGPYKCPKCKRGFRSQKSLSGHMASHKRDR